MRRECTRCGSTFDGRSSRAKFCSAACRVAANRAKDDGGVVIDLPRHTSTEPLPESVENAIAGRESEPLAQAALVLANRIARSGEDSAAGVAALNRELRATLGALAVARPDEKTAGKIAQFRARRAAAGNA